MRVPRWATVAILAPMAAMSLLHAFSPPQSRSIAAAQTSAVADTVPVPDPVPVPVPVPVPDTVPVPGTAAVPGTAVADTASPAALARALPPVTSAHWSDGKFTHFSSAELRDMASRCELRWRLPPFGGEHLPSFSTDHEEQVYLHVLADEHRELTKQLHQLHRELGGEDGPIELRPLMDALRTHPDAYPVDVHARLARSLVDDGTAPKEIYGHFLHEALQSGQRFEGALVRELGEDRGRALASQAGTRHTLTGCSPENALYRSER